MIENKHQNKLIIFLGLLGVSFYSIEKGFNIERRNVSKKFKNFKDKYSPEFEAKVKKLLTNNKQKYG